MKEKILKAIANVLRRVRPADPHNERSVSVERASDSGACTPDEALVLATRFRTDRDYRSQPDNFTDEDLRKYCVDRKN